MQRSVSVTLALLAALLLADRPCAAEPPAPRRLTVAILWFVEKPGMPEATHWRYTLRRLLRRQLAATKALNVLSINAVQFASRQAKVSAGTPLDASEARRLGETIGAQRVIWGEYRRHEKEWRVTARLLDVATGNVSADLRAASPDWFAVRDRLADQLLQALGVTPSAAERTRMGRRWTNSPVALDWHGKALEAQFRKRPLAEEEESLRKAVEVDPDFVVAHVALAATYFSRGNLDEAEKVAQRALKLRPDDARAHGVLGVVRLFRGDLAGADRALHEACRLDPGDAELLSRLGQVHATQRKWDAAIANFADALQIDPFDAVSHALLGRIYATRQERAKALAELQEAVRLGPENMGAEQMIAVAYDTLGEAALALEHYEIFLRLARQTGANPEAVRALQERAWQLKASLTATSL
jgi:tetratricopeptide (TPR) repeat protein